MTTLHIETSPEGLGHERKRLIADVAIAQSRAAGAEARAEHAEAEVERLTKACELLHLELEAWKRK